MLCTPPVPPFNEPLKIGPKQYGILATIHYEGPTSQRAVGEMLKIDRSTMVLLTDELEEQKVLSRKDHPKDRRYYFEKSILKKLFCISKCTIDSE